MSDERQVIAYWLILVVSVDYGLGCGPAEIGKQYTIASTANVPYNDDIVVWHWGEMTVLYDSSKLSPNIYPEMYIGTRTDLTIINVTKNDAIKLFQQVINGDLRDGYTCALPVYKRAITPTCEAVTLKGNQIQTKCTTAEVFPHAKCQFILQNGGTSRKTITDGTSYIEYTHTDPQPEGNEYYSTSCTLQYPVDGLKPGNWTLQVIMYPDLTNVSLAQGTTGQTANTLHLSVPTVNIDPNNCPKGLAGEGDTYVKYGYIRQGERASCMCTRAFAGNPQGTISWSSKQGGNFDMLSQSEEAATIQINSPGIFTCRSTSVLDGSHSATYTPNYSYDLLRERQNEPLNLCSAEGVDLTVICAVKKSDIRPGLNMITSTLTKPNGFAITLRSYLDVSGGAYRIVNKLRITSRGSHSLVCEARNPIFPEIKQTQSLTIEIREPPNDTPLISARSSQNGDILVEGDNVTVTCEVSGGYPPVQTVTLTCGQEQSVTSNGTSATLTLNEIGLRYNDTNCICQATHVTGCYDLKGVFPLIVLMANQSGGREHEDSLLIITKAELAGVVIGSIVGTVVLFTVILLVVFIVRKEKAKRKNRSRDTAYDEIERPKTATYQNVRPVDPNHPYQTINQPNQASASNIVSANHETDHTYRNQIFDDNAEPDPNAYSEILN